MKKTYAKLLALMLSLCISFTTCYYVHGLEKSDTKTPKTEKEETSNDETSVYKDETVYVLANADGTVEKIIVSDYIKNCLSANALSDKSELKNIKNVKGDEGYTLGGDNSLVWDANGNDIYYQGEISKELPVTFAVKYKFNGETVSPKKLIGKSGKVTIEYKFKNNQYSYMDINGKKEKIYVPFVMLTGMMFDNDVFSNITVTNGRAIDDGEKSFVVGYALPGMQETLGLDNKILSIPDGFTVTADVKHFKLGMAVTVATSGVFNNIDTSKLDINKLDDTVKELTDGVNSLVDGSSKLYGGLKTLSENSSALVDGIKKLADGAKALKIGADTAYSGAQKLSDGLNALNDKVGAFDDGIGKLKDGSNNLKDGLDTICQNNDTLNGGADKIFGMILKTVEDTVSGSGITINTLTKDNYKTILNGLLDNPNDTQKGEMINIASTSLDEKFKAKGVDTAYLDGCKYLLATGKTEEEVGNILVTDKGTLISAVGTAATPDGQNAIKALCLKLAKDSLKPKIEEGISSLDSYSQFALGIKNYTDGVSSAKDGAVTISENMNGLKDGSSALIDGVGQLNDGMILLKGGIYDIANGAGTLFDGLLTVKNGTPALVNGVNALKDGAKQLYEGIKKLNNDGIGKIATLYKNDAKPIILRAKAMINVAKNYKSFSGINDLSDGSVKFIYRTDEVN
ncbi:MAG: hypothetical protein MJ080_04125 [Clostridia bacterium]|nr:hypothetical protein [Clostridia bacterium]